MVLFLQHCGYYYTIPREREEENPIGEKTNYYYLLLVLIVITLVVIIAI